MLEVSMTPERANPLDIDKERIRFLYPTRSIIATEGLHERSQEASFFRSPVLQSTFLLGDF